MSICPWDSIPGKEPKVVECIFGMESSSAKNPMTPHSNVGDDLPGKVCDVRPLEELTRAIQGEEIWHEEKWQYRILPLLEWLAA